MGSRVPPPRSPGLAVQSLGSAAAAPVARYLRRGPLFHARPRLTMGGGAVGLRSARAAPNGTQRPLGPPRGPSRTALRPAARHTVSVCDRPGLARLIRVLRLAPPELDR
ncbi:hypothetical protein NDU88_003121 [Pleurodeles waltl]|uniref:Uncharacterized protein n=1 Tax=Pleurodeles waltl TaxID=8319 RepID=A0AAV7WSN4_PLEWA|nr:hypothetical protein NDU88_003121 [Pleurodeles waltl]